MTRLLAGDIGGTNARLVLYEAEASQLGEPSEMTKHRVVAQMYYKNHEFESFTEVLCAFTALPDVVGVPIAACCLATAGPVSNNRINFTNREGWIIDGRAIREEFGIPRVRLVNDFVAAGYGVLGLESSEVITLQPGEPAASPQAESGVPKALVGAGTGLGECFLAPDENGVYSAFASEGGHVEFAPRSVLEEELLHFLQDRLDLPMPSNPSDRPRVSVERVVSGRGLENIYEFLRVKFPDQIDTVLDSEYNESSERGRLIGAQKYNYSLFNQALEMMFAIYGGEVGNVALKYLPLGGLYIGGGIAPKNVEYINSVGSAFMRRLLDKGRMRSIMTSIPVHLVMKEDIGLRGAHVVAARLAREGLVEEVSPEKDDAVQTGLDATRAPLTPVLASPAAKAAKPAALLSPYPERATVALRPAYEDSLRNAIADYPLTYAGIATFTAAFTAATIVLAGRVYAVTSPSK